MDTGDNTDLEKIQARREKHKARGINGNGFGMSLGEATRTWHALRANDAEKRGDVADDPRNGLMGKVHHWVGPKVLQGGPNSNREAWGAGGPDLQEQVISWSGPKASDGEKGGPNQRGSKGDVPLPGQAAQWPGPASRDFKDVNREVPMPDYNARPLNEVASNWNTPLVADAGEKVTLASHQDSLLAQASYFRPPSSQDQPIAGGSMSSTDGPNSNQLSAKRKLNPIFVEALMRWPTGLSGFERQEMAWTRWWALMPSFVSALCSQNPSKQGSLFDDAA
jgi:hypothetical protein